jgi:hypothetical protein
MVINQTPQYYSIVVKKTKLTPLCKDIAETLGDGLCGQYGKKNLNQD